MSLQNVNPCELLFFFFFLLERKVASLILGEGKMGGLLALMGVCKEHMH